jgi:anti-anti-sigma regulatory factor
MRADQESMGVVHAVFAPPIVDGVAVGELDAAFEKGARELVLDLSNATHVDGEAVVLLAWLAQKLENAGGKLAVTARRVPEDARVTRTLWMGDLTRILGVHPALDKAILHQLTAGARGAAPQ